MDGPDIFLSYSRDDREAAAKVAYALEHEGYSVWWDAALHSGETFDEVIERNLREAKVVLVLWSPNSVSSRWVRAEATRGDRRNIMVPAILEECELPIAFELKHNTDLSHWDGSHDDENWKQLLADIAHHLGKEVMSLPAAKVSEPAQAAPIDAPTATPQSQTDDNLEQTQFFTSASTDPYEDVELHVLSITEGEEVRQHVVGPLGVKIGRSAPADIKLADPRVSRSHCQVNFSGEELEVTDLSSTNGTYVDGNRIDSPTVLPLGSELRIGHVKMTHEIRKRDELFN